VGFESSRAGYSFIILVLAFPAYYGSFGQVGYIFSLVVQRELILFHKAVAAMSPTAEIAAVLFSFLFSFVITLYVEFPLSPPFFPFNLTVIFQ
jgi:ATP-binding cassette subfamily G (WHITE) protein 2 (SNQ2)